MTNFAESYKELFDFETMQANFRKLYNLDAMKTSLEQLYNFDAIQENWKKAFDQDAVSSLQDAFAKAADKEAYRAAAEKNLELTSNLIANSAHAASDALVLQATRTRQSIDEFLKQIDSLTTAKDAEEVFTIQKSCGESMQQAATELTRDISSILSSAMESNINLWKEAVTPVKENAAQKKAAPKTAAKKDPA